MKRTTIHKVNKTIALSIVAVIMLMIAVAGVTYAFFNLIVEGNDESSSVIIDVADLGVITFEDGDVINAHGIYPMEEDERIRKTFTIVASENTVNVDYIISLEVTTNTFIQQFENEFTYTLDGASDSGGIATTGVSELVPIQGVYAIGEGTLKSEGDTHTYVFTIGLNEVHENQNLNQNKAFLGKLSVQSKKYTNEGNIWGN